MKAIREWWHRFLPGSEPTNGTPPVSESEPPYPVLCAMVREDGRWKLVIGDNGAPRVRMVIVPSDIVSRFNSIEDDVLKMQLYLESLPFSYRKRKPRAKVEDAKCEGVNTSTEPENV